MALLGRDPSLKNKTQDRDVDEPGVKGRLRGNASKRTKPAIHLSIASPKQGYVDPLKLPELDAVPADKKRVAKLKRKAKKQRPTSPRTSPSTNDSEGDRLYCVCRCPYDDSRAMIQCDRCLNWFHFDCVHIDEDSIPETYECDNCSFLQDAGRPRKSVTPRPDLSACPDKRRLDGFICMLLKAAAQQDRRGRTKKTFSAKRPRPEILSSGDSDPGAKAILKEGFVYLVTEQESRSESAIGPQTTRLEYKPRGFEEHVVQSFGAEGSRY